MKKVTGKKIMNPTILSPRLWKYFSHMVITVSWKICNITDIDKTDGADPTWREYTGEKFSRLFLLMGWTW